MDQWGTFPVGAVNEQARIAVTRRKKAIGKSRATHPQLAEHLKASITRETAAATRR
jgi:hypothetical protein